MENIKKTTKQCLRNIGGLPSKKAVPVLTSEDGFSYQVFKKKDTQEKYIRINGINTECDVLTIPEKISGINVEVIKKGAFQENTELIQVKIPEGIRIIGAEAFKDCVNLEMVELPFDLKVINKACFQGCSALKNFSLPYGLENICQDALDGCTKLDALKLPSKLEHIGKNAFGNSLIKKGNLMVKKVGSVKKNIKLMSEAERKAEQEIKNDSLIYEVLSNNKNQYIRINGATENVEKNLIIPDKIDGIPIEIIAKGAFENNDVIELVILPSSIRLVGANAFRNCSNLCLVELPSKLEAINASTFEHCQKLRTVIFPYKLKSIASFAFRNCSNLSSLELPDSIGYIGKNAFSRGIKLKKEQSGSVQDENSKKGKTVTELCERTGWSYEKCERELAVSKSLGIPNRTYLFKYLYQLSRRELVEFAEILELNQQRQKDNNLWLINCVCEKTGWNTDKAKEEMDKAKSSGISYVKYIQKEYWNRQDGDFLTEFLKNDKKRIQQNKAKYVDEICQKTGWSKGKAELEVLKSKVNCGASYEDFLVFKFYEKNAEEQKKYVTLDMFSKMRMKYNEHFVGAENFDNKAKFNEIFKEFIKHRWFVNRHISYQEFLDKIRDLKKIIIKPLAATQGIGVQVQQCNIGEMENQKLYNDLLNMELCIIEEYIVQHEELAEFCRSAVNTIRVMTLNYNHECKFLYSVFRMGKDGVVDNFHAGGIAATVDIVSGIVSTNAADLAGNVFTHSLATGKKIKGFKIPHWDQIISTCKELNGKVEGVNIVGWDFAITKNGVDLIEGNPGASYIVAQIPNIEDNIGLADVMALPYL